MNRRRPARLVRPPGVRADCLVRVFRVAPEWAGRRLDTFLGAQLRNTSRTRAKQIAAETAYTADGRRLRGSERLKAETHVVLWRPPPDESDEPVPIHTLYEDEHLLVVDKPPLMAVHPTARHHRVTVIKLLEEQRPGQYLSLIHRIDRETSGVLLLAKSHEADRAFKRMLEDRSRAETGQYGAHKAARVAPILKVYLAITWGVPKAGLIDLALEPDTNNPLRVKMRVAEKEGLEARTEVSVVEEKTTDDGRAYALVSCRLLTGRQHQIRAHLAAQGTAVVGDKLYGPDDRMLARAADNELTEEDLLRLELPRQALHAHKYGLTHTVTREELTLESPLPPDLQDFWDNLA